MIEERDELRDRLRSMVATCKLFVARGRAVPSSVSDQVFTICERLRDNTLAKLDPPRELMVALDVTRRAHDAKRVCVYPIADARGEERWRP